MNTKNNGSSTNFLVQGSILAIASIISRIVGLIYRVPLTAIIGKTGNNYYGTAFEIYSIILIISSYSLPLAVSKLVATRMEKGEVKNAMKVLKGSLLFAFLSGTVFMCIVFFFADVFTDILKTPLASIALRVLSPVILIVAVLGVFRGFFQGLQTMMPSAISQIIEQILNAAVSIAAAYYLFSYGAKIGRVLGNRDDYAAAYGAAGGTLGTAIGALSALIFVLFVYFVFYKKFKRRIIRDHKPNKETYGFVFKMLIITIIPVLLSTTLYNVVSILDQGIFKNIVSLQGYDKKQISEWWGVYTGQYKVLINVPISIASAIAASAVPTLSAAYNSDNQKKVRSQIHSATRFIMMIAFPCTIGMAVLAGPIMMLLFSDSDPTSAKMLMYGSVAILFYSLSTLSNGLLQGIDRLRIPVRNAAFSLVFQLVFLIVVLEKFDMNIFGMVYANAFYAFCMSVLNHLSVMKYSKVKQNIHTTYLMPLLCSSIMGIAVYLSYKLLHIITHSNAVSCVIAMFVGVICYFVLMLMLKGITQKDLAKFPEGNRLISLAKKLHLL